jgi:DNA-binding transcriptional MocR family regulator
MSVNSFDSYFLSWRPNRSALTKPYYLALAAELERSIASGELTEGVKLPPQRELADFLGLDFTTITRAYNLCREKRIIYGVTGRGTFVSPPQGNHDEKKAAIELGVVQSFPEIGGSAIVEAAHKVLSREYAERMFTYTNMIGTGRNLIVAGKWLERCGVKTTPSGIGIFPGAQSAISSALLSLFHPGDALAVDEFTYGNLIHLARLAHLRLIPILGDNDGMLPDALSDSIKKHNIKGIFLMPECANPTTISLSESRKDALSDVIAKNKLILIEDDLKTGPTTGTGRTMQNRIPDLTIYLCGSTRTIAPGLRATYLSFPPPVAPAMSSALRHLSIKASVLDAEILGELVANGEAEKILRAKQQKAEKANREFNRIFSIKGDKNLTRFFRTVPLAGTSGHGMEIERELLGKGIRVCHSDRFCVRKGNEKSFLRVSLSSAGKIPNLISGLKILTEYLFDN